MCEDEQCKKVMKQFIRYGIIVLLFMSGVFYTLQFTIPNFTNFQEIGNFISSTFAIAISIAGSIVAIFLALSALKTSQETNKLTELLARDQEIQEQKQLILEKVQKTRDITTNIIENYYEIAFNIYEFVSKIQDQLVSNKVIFLVEKMNSIDKQILNSQNSQQQIEEYQKCTAELNFILPEFEKVRISVNNMSDALIELKKDLFSHQVYQEEFTSGLNELSLNLADKDNFYTDAKNDFINLTFQMKKYTTDFTGPYLLNLIEHISSKVNELEKVPEIKKDILIAIVLGYFTAPYHSNGKIHLIGSVIFYDLLVNLPLAEKIKRVLKSCEGHTKHIDIIVNQVFCSSDDIEKFTKEMIDIRRDIMDKFDLIFEFENQDHKLSEEEQVKLNIFIEKYNNLKEIDDAKRLLAEIEQDIKNYDLNSMTPYLSQIQKIVSALLAAINDEQKRHYH